jgi:hypothetical protein
MTQGFVVRRLEHWSCGYDGVNVWLRRGRSLVRELDRGLRAPYIHILKAVVRLTLAPFRAKAYSMNKGQSLEPVRRVTV